MSDWEILASFLADLPDEDRERFSAHAALDLPEGNTEDIFRHLQTYAGASPGATPSSLLATTGAQAGATGDRSLALTLGRAALDLADNPGDLGLAHVCLAQTHFRNRGDREELASFVEHCRAPAAVATPARSATSASPSSTSTGARPPRPGRCADAPSRSSALPGMIAPRPGSVSAWSVSPGVRHGGLRAQGQRLTLTLAWPMTILHHMTFRGRADCRGPGAGIVRARRGTASATLRGPEQLRIRGKEKHE